MNLTAAVMNLLEHRRWATHAVVAVARAYGRRAVLDQREKAAAKVRRNILEAFEGVPGSLPVRNVDGMLAALFPEAAAEIRQPWPPAVALEHLRARKTRAEALAGRSSWNWSSAFSPGPLHDREFHSQLHHFSCSPFAL